MIEKFALTLATKLLQYNMDTKTDKNEIEIIQYGLECIFNTIIPLTLFVCYAIVKHMIPEFLLWIFIFFYFRNKVGGYHAPSHILCIIFSSIYGLISFFTLPYIMNIPLSIKIITVIFIMAIHLLCKPNIHHMENKNLSYIKRTKLQIFYFLLIILILIIILHYHALSLCNAIYLGILNVEFLYFIEKIKRFYFYVIDLSRKF